MKTEHTKRLISNSLKEFLKTKPLKRMTVQELCTRCEITRGTFYYHFRDLSDLICWIYHTEVTLPSRKLLLEHPFRYEIATRFALECAYASRDFYYQALQEQGQNNLRQYAMREAEESWAMLWESYLRSYDREEIPGSGIQHILKYFASAHHNAVLSWVNGGMKESPEQIADLIEQASHAGLLAAFEKASTPRT